MKQVSLLVGLVTMSFAALMILTLQIARTIPSPLDLGAQPGCEAPCWQNITPNTTPLDTAVQNLEDAGYTFERDYERSRFLAFEPGENSAACGVRLNYSAAVVTSITLTDCQNVTLGDLSAVIGSPDGILASNTALTFREGAVVATMRAMTCSTWFTPQSPVLAVYINAPHSENGLSSGYSPSVMDVYPWRGFISRQRYQLLEPETPRCG